MPQTRLKACNGEYGNFWYLITQILRTWFGNDGIFQCIGYSVRMTSKSNELYSAVFPQAYKLNEVVRTHFSNVTQI